MSRVMMLVSAEGALLAETRVDGDGSDGHTRLEAQLRDEAIMSGFTEEEVRSARIVGAGDPPFQP